MSASAILDSTIPTQRQQANGTLLKVVPITLAGGTATTANLGLTVAPGAGLLATGYYSVYVTPASSANVVANSGALTIAYASATTISVTSANGADAGSYLIWIFA